MTRYTASEIAEAILRRVPDADGLDDALALADSDYVTLSRDGVRFFGERFMAFLFNSGLDKFADERNDCDDFALHAASFAKLDHARFHKGDEALAFGFAWMMTDTQAHAVNVALHTGADGLELALYEPQILWNDRKQIGKPHMSMRELPVSSVRRWQLLCL